MRALAAVLLPLGGCVGVWTDSHAVYLWLPELSGAGQGPQYGALPVLRGTRLCPRFCADNAPPDSCTDAIAACHEFGVYGCHVVDEVGTMFLPVRDTCGGPDDAVSFDVFAPGDLRAALVDWEALGDDLFDVGYRYEWDPQGLRLAGRFGLQPTLVAPDDRLVAFESADATLWASAGSVERDGLYYVTVEPGVPATLSLDVGGAVYADFAAAIGVEPSDAASIEVLAGIDASGRLGARAVFRDRQDRLIYGVPTTWTLERGAVVLDSAGLPGPDFVQVLDVCVPPEDDVGEREAVLHASFGALSDTVRLTWTAGADPTWQRSELCPPEPTGTTTSGSTTETSDPAGLTGRSTRGASQARSGRCGCDGADVGGVAAWSALGLVVARRRRR